MEEYIRDKGIEKARKMLSVLSIPEEQLVEFDNLCRDFDLTISDVTDWKEQHFFNPQD